MKSLNMQKTYQEILTFSQTARFWCNTNEKQSKFKYALERMLQRSKKALEPYFDKQADLNVKFAAVDKDGVILTNDKDDFQYKKDDLQKRNEALRALVKEAIEIEPYIATEPPPKPLSVEEEDAFMDFVLESKPDAA